jgi:hypothetical protein
MKKRGGCKYDHWNCSHSTLYSSLLTDGANNLEYYKTLSREGLPVTIIQGNWAHFKLQKMKCCKLSPEGHIQSTLFSSQLTYGPKKLDFLNYSMLEEACQVRTNT